MAAVIDLGEGWLISHEKLLNSFYKEVECNGKLRTYEILKDLFKIVSPYKNINALKSKRKCGNQTDSSYKELIETVDYVQEMYNNLFPQLQLLLKTNPDDDPQKTNTDAIELSNKVYEDSGKSILLNTIGENVGKARLIEINNCNFLFPENCKFYSKDVAEIERYLIDIKYDLILLDPPWWNKYIRRKRAKTQHGYVMMYNDQLRDIPLEKLLKDDGLVIVWCTNSMQHLNYLCNEIFPKWNVSKVAKWYWLKITEFGKPICAFSKPPRKQPFEQIILGSRNSHNTFNLKDGKLIISVPSALHSHKPPLIELLKEFVPNKKDGHCLEIFARYLIPGWTSWGLETLRFQHESLFGFTS